MMPCLEFNYQITLWMRCGDLKWLNRQQTSFLPQHVTMKSVFMQWIQNNHWFLRTETIQLSLQQGPTIVAFLCAADLTLKIASSSSLPRRARTTSQKRKSISPSHHPTSSTIIFLIIKRTNAETITIIPPLQKKTNKKKHSQWKMFFLQDKSFIIIYCKCHVINVMCWV